MKRRKFIKKSGQALLAISSISITGAMVTSCQSDDDDGFFDDGYYDNGYYDDGYYDDGYYDDGYYNDGYYDDGYYDDGYYGNSDLIEDTLLDGLWFVASYIDSGVDETSDYNGYSVDFNTGNQVVATNGSNTNNGTWVVSDQGTELTLNFTGSPFDEFNDDWDIISVLPNRIELQDVSGGGSGTDILVLEKS
ncbi:MAG: hypothetical protein CL596_10830 [Alteromonas sp.]|nr:hypothetical protein [Alteromonas sp.]MAY21321.1 hypothetical protein [Flavobacteriaceae bacterium]|tara:strand:+ start:612 stop:1187 length:576 start_codon:yes stop_codon:yes gene_type:complete